MVYIINLEMLEDSNYGTNKKNGRQFDIIIIKVYIIISPNPVMDKASCFKHVSL